MPEVAVVPRPCRGCGVLVYDLRHVDTGRHAPIEVEPVLGGNIKIDIETGTYRLTGTDIRRPDEVRHVSHFATCPAATRFRSKRVRVAR